MGIPQHRKISYPTIIKEQKPGKITRPVIVSIIIMIKYMLCKFTASKY